MSEENYKRIKVRELLKEFIKDLDTNLKHFCKIVREDLRNQKDYVIGITGYPGMGKSQLAAIIGILIDYDYYFENICFIPTSKDIEATYMNLPMYSVLHIDEASRGLHKQKWYDKVQQKLNELYDTEREGHFLCTLLLMPRFQNFTENFRNFRIKYWINILDRGLAIAYKRDEDKDAKDPWHIDENYKTKQKQWKGQKIYERDIPSQIAMEQRTANYWFYFRVPEIPTEVWRIYQELKKKSREISKSREEVAEVDTYEERKKRERRERMQKVKELYLNGMKPMDIAISLGISVNTTRRDLDEIKAGIKLAQMSQPIPQGNTYINNNPIKEDKNKIIPEEFNKI